ncbi:MAG: acylphosphatase [Methanomassiliicoccales archaeon]|jgi:acylphosphatase
MTSRAEVRFRGRVQGVHFRDFTRRFARKHGVNGWVRNMPDGSVEALFEGDGDAISEVIRLLSEEHPKAQVDHIDVIWSRSKDEFSQFEIY